ncbi:putative uncharacterized protein DDB_G0282133 isoform X2 [Musca domestica]|uniref:Uncharacterized protein n=1 Tax=Musca domestica TaxID=7370 RepID=A0ABM3V488_MUSDO|nr:putative uncharacterized protein DDB_G0282133 isoform X2 [Musca domestica]
MRNTRSTKATHKHPKIKEKPKRRITITQNKNSESDNSENSLKLSDNNSSSDTDHGKSRVSDNCTSPSKLSDSSGSTKITRRSNRTLVTNQTNNEEQERLQSSQKSLNEQDTLDKQKSSKQNGNHLEELPTGKSNSSIQGTTSSNKEIHTVSNGSIEQNSTEKAIANDSSIHGEDSTTDLSIPEKNSTGDSTIPLLEKNTKAECVPREVSTNDSTIPLLKKNTEPECVPAEVSTKDSIISPLEKNTECDAKKYSFGSLTVNGSQSEEFHQNIETLLKSDKNNSPNTQICSNSKIHSKNEIVLTPDKNNTPNSQECLNTDINLASAEEPHKNTNTLPTLDTNSNPAVKRVYPVSLINNGIPEQNLPPGKNAYLMLKKNNGPDIKTTSNIHINGTSTEEIIPDKTNFSFLLNNHDSEIQKSSNGVVVINNVAKDVTNPNTVHLLNGHDNSYFTTKENPEILKSQNGYNIASNGDSVSLEDESLVAVLKELNLCEELYNFMKSKNITADALKCMKIRHIDELFQGMNLNLKIIFEHRLFEWQERLKKQTYVAEEGETSLKISQKVCYGENCQLLAVERKPSGSISSYHITGDQDLSNFSNQLMDVIQNGLNSLLKQFQVPSNGNQKEIIEQTTSKEIVTETPTAYVIAPETNQTSNNVKILSVVNLSESQPPGTVILDPADLEYTSLDAIIQAETASMHSSQNNQNEVASCDDDNSPRMKIPSKQIIRSNMLEPSPTHFGKRKWGIETELKEILQMYKPGNLIMKHYKYFGSLTSKLRTDLVHIIVDHFIANDEFMCVNQCRDLAKQIVELFPTEHVETYFYQQNKSLTPRGKLWNHHNNERRAQKKVSSKSYSKSNRLKMESTCGHLKKIEDVNFLLKKWNATFDYRRYQLHSGFFSNWKAYFDEYPFCKQQNYATFIDADLSTLYSDLIFDDQLWEDFLNNFQIHLWNRCKNEYAKDIYDELCAMSDVATTTDYFPIRLLQLLHCVFDGNTKDQTYMDDPLRQFTVEVSNLVDLKEIVIERKRFYLENNQQCKPYIAVVRENNTYVHYSVVIDSTGFGCDNYKESLILCFKLYLFFDICYPEESYCVWLFIQKYFFNKQSLIIEPIVDSFIDEIRVQNKVDLEVHAVEDGEML